MWALPGLGIELVSPALAGGFLTTEPPGKPQALDFSRDPSALNAKGCDHRLNLYSLLWFTGKKYKFRTLITEANFPMIA